MSKLLREPLVHFLVAGLGLFVLFGILNKDVGYNEKVIRVNQDALLTFIQYRSQAFEPNIGLARLNTMPDADFERLVADYVKEEALHREALVLGMDQNDYIIKRRLIQSIEFITAGFAIAGVELSEEDIEQYYQANKQQYYVEPNITFTHVFFSSDSHGADIALELAETRLSELNERGVPFNEAPQHGDRFLYALNYVEREPGFIAGHFGPRMASALFDLEADESEWKGPFESSYGFHLTLVPKKSAGRTPELDEIMDIIRYDAERDAVNAQKDMAIQAIVDTYEVQLDLARPFAESAQ